jgi:hypothetical protein
MKKCSKCGEAKPLQEFTRDKSKKCGYKSACKTCLNTPERKAYQTAYRKDHADYFREKHAEYRERNREAVRVYRREHYDPQKAHAYRVQNLERLLEYNRAYNATERGRARTALATAKRRAHIATGDSGITLRALFSRDGGRCQLCGGLCDYNDFILRDGVTVVGNRYPSIDHIVPLSRGGSHTWDNVQLAHKGCNCVKYNRTN